jgi:hypothetical protein
MNSSRVGSFLVAIALTMNSCGGGGGDNGGGGGGGSVPPPSPPPPPDRTCGVVPATGVSAAGPAEGAWGGPFPIFNGIDFLGGSGIVQPSGEASFWIGSGYLWVGSVLATTQGDVQSTLRSYVRAAPGPIGALAGSGGVLELDEVTAKGSLTGKFQGAFSDCQPLSLSYSNVYERPASLATLAGVFTYTDEDPHTLTLTIHADGQMNGSDLLGCVVQGSAAVPDATKNYYNGIADVTSCGDLDGHYEGILSLSDEVENDNSWLRIALSNSEAAIFGDLHR